MAIVFKDAKNIPEHCDYRMDAVLFSDGTHEGSEEAVRSLKAHRDGVSDRVHYWIKRLSLENKDGSGLDGLEKEAECATGEDLQGSREHGFDFLHDQAEPVLHSYWDGRYFVDKNVQETFNPGERSPELTFHQLWFQITTWKDGIASHPSSVGLDVEFPPISQPVGGCGDSRVTNDKK